MEPRGRPTKFSVAKTPFQSNGKFIDRFHHFIDKTGRKRQTLR